MNRIFSSLILIMISIGFSLQSCDKEKKSEQKNLTETEIHKTEDSIKSAAEENYGKSFQYTITVEEIDSLQFNAVKKKMVPKKKTPVKITDITVAKKMLKGIVEFDEKIPEYPLVTNINFRNGKNTKGKLYYEFEECIFKAYFPEEDILLCEGGHTSEVSFNLKNGNETEQTGNPDILVFSPKEHFRLNGHFGGQECSSYFIQRKINNEFIKVVQLDEEFEKLTKHWLCTVGESFWSDENTLYLKETEFVEDGLKSQIFKVKILAK